MSQHDYNIANQTFPATRTDLNNALGAIATNNAGNSAPSTTYASQWWFDSDGNQLYQRNKDNDAWVKILTIGATSDKVESIADSIAIASTGGVTITTADNTDTLTLTSTDADASVGPNLRLYRNSSSPADNDDLATIDFEGRNDNSQDVQYGMIRAILKDASDGTEDGTLEFHHMKNGSLAPSLQITPDECVINESSNDYDFRVESNGNANMLFVDGGNNFVGIGTSSPSATLHVDASGGGVIRVSRNSASTANYMALESDGTNGTVKAIQSLLISAGGSERVRIDSSGKVGIGTSSPSANLEVRGSSSNGQIYLGGSTTGTYGKFYSDNDGTLIASADGGNNASSSSFRVEVDATERFRVDSTGRITSNAETAGDVTRGGLCLNQGTHDTNILTFKSDDVAHGMTSNLETDTYFRVSKVTAANGAAQITGAGESTYALYFESFFSVDNTVTSTSAQGGTMFSNYKYNGSTGLDATISSDQNIFVVRNQGGTKFLVKGDGDIFADGSLSAYDTYEDAQLVRAYDLSHGKGVIDSAFDKYVKYNHETLAKAKLVGREEDGTPNHFINVTGMQRLHNGAIWQQYEKTERLANAMYELAKAAVGEEKANEILEQNEIKLLN